MNSIGNAPWAARVITLFPDAFPGTLGVSMIDKAAKKDVWRLEITDLRKYGIGKHLVVDDTPFGGGAGMLLRPDVADAALRDVCEGSESEDCEIICLSPCGEQFSQQLAEQLTMCSGVTIFCPRYEGVDHRVIEKWKMREVRVGNAVLCGGEVAAALILEAVVRLLPGVISPKSLLHESFADGSLVGECPQYTALREWEGRLVPPVLLSGHHEEIKNWRIENARSIKP